MKKVAIVPTDKLTRLQAIRGKIAIYQFDPRWQDKLEVYPSDADYLTETGAWALADDDGDPPKKGGRKKGRKANKVVSPEELEEMGQDDDEPEGDEDVAPASESLINPGVPYEPEFLPNDEDEGGYGD